LLYLIRHAQSISNKLNSSTGSIFDELSFEGREECLSLRIISQELKEKFNLKIVSSSAGRALETAVLLFGGDITIDHDWMETDGGYLQNIPEEYVEKFFNLKNDITRKYPNGESNLIMEKRVLKSFKRYLELIHSENIAIVTHLGPILAVSKHLNFKVNNIKNLDGIVIKNENEKIDISFHNKLTN